MTFNTSQSTENNISLFHLHNEEEGVTVSIAPEFGAMLHAFSVPLQGKAYNIISNYSSGDDIHQNLAKSYKSSKLSPFACRIKNGQYTWNGKLFEFNSKFGDGTAIHGLLFNKSFTETHRMATEFMATVAFQYDYKAEDAGYPHDYSCIIRYTLLPNRVLQLQTTLKNNSNTAIPIQDGWHPYFQLNTKVDNCLLSFPSSGMVEFDQQLIPTGHIIPFDNFNEGKFIHAMELDNCFLLDAGAGQPVCTLSNAEKHISIRFIIDEQYPYLQLYIPPDRQSIAIENLSGAPDAFNNKMGLILLEPGTEKTLNVHYEVSLNTE